jgi:hypothetical protein
MGKAYDTTNGENECIKYIDGEERKNVFGGGGNSKMNVSENYGLMRIR